MCNHHGISPSSLEHNPRPADREIFMKPPSLCHDGRTHGDGGEQHG